MRKVAVLFASYHGYERVQQLNGVIQIFNLIYVMSPNINEALKEYKGAGLPSDFSSPEDLLKYDIEHLVHPVYLEFADFAKIFKDKAQQYFDIVIKDSTYLEENFDSNKFIHPQHLCGNGCNKDASKKIRGKFKKEPMSDEEIAKGVSLPRYSLSKEDKFAIVDDFISHYKKAGLETFEFKTMTHKPSRSFLKMIYR